ncbi:MAG TPA: lysine--tRNA ligase [Myxococcota bacterium]|nr:lysine--tRNA ligase [Myxococcota bacterium]HQK52478.1 lysine--tRNA ligase [Myxococcota bacterium]
METTEQELIRQRRAKQARLEEIDGVRYPNDFRTDGLIAAVIGPHQHQDGEALEAQAPVVAIAGRVMAINSFGKAAFLRIRDQSGSLQAYVKKDQVDETTFERMRLTDIGDIVGVRGTLFRTRTGELTVMAREYRVLAKSQRPLPEKWHGLKDLEARHRMRYLDLLVNEDSRNVFRTRARIIQYIRRFLDQRDYLEVETPMMHPVLGGANARPFRTHHNALDMDLYLRIAPELYLKRLVVGGFERVYEINRNFRNEGISHKHNPEFTMIEFYQAFATYLDLMDLTEDLLRGLVRELTGGHVASWRGTPIDFEPPFRRLPVCQALRDHCGYDDDALVDPARSLAAARACGVPEADLEAVVRKSGGLAGGGRDLALEIGMLAFEEKVEPLLDQPTFVTDFPAAVSPLSRRKDSDPFLVDRFELYVGCSEIANAFSELNDPEDQEQRFRAQLAAKSRGDAEAMELDEDYVRALSYGLPPTAGEGIGIDRLVMLLTGRENIRDVILFPLMRPES